MFLPICSTCKLEENLRRAGSEERKVSGITKLTDFDEVRKLRSNYERYMFDEVEVRAHVIDVKNLTSEAAASSIFEWTMLEFSRS
jgi:low affinity Fe/Cu permease